MDAGLVVREMKNAEEDDQLQGQCEEIVRKKRGSAAAIMEMQK